jgi:hypothetical protein
MRALLQQLHAISLAELIMTPCTPKEVRSDVKNVCGDLTSCQDLPASRWATQAASAASMPRSIACTTRTLHKPIRQFFFLRNLGIFVDVRRFFDDDLKHLLVRASGTCEGWQSSQTDKI